MKNKKMFVLVGVLVAMLVVVTFITIFIINLNKDKEIMDENQNIINFSYNNLKNEVSNYNELRNDVLQFINNFYFNTIADDYSNNVEILNKYNTSLGKITSEVKVLDDKCNVIYKDKDINTICTNYKTDYETIANLFMNDINNYNNKLSMYNNESEEKFALFKSDYISDYIDYNNDNKYEQKVVVNG